MRSVKFLAKSFSILHVYVRESPNCSSPCSSTCTSEYHPIVRALVVTCADYQCENHAVRTIGGSQVYLSFFGDPRDPLNYFENGISSDSRGKEACRKQIPKDGQLTSVEEVKGTKLLHSLVDGLHRTVRPGISVFQKNP
jgi:hypothetical protein